jgi:hypothetical protein
MSNDELIRRGNEDSKQGRRGFSIRQLLRDHKDSPVTDQVEQRARQSFDDLLDFFTKLDYYLTPKLISKQELYYFSYYINQCACKKGAVLEYAKNYGYAALFRLLYVLNTKSDYAKSYKVPWESESQESRYYDLRNDLPVF